MPILSHKADVGRIADIAVRKPVSAGLFSLGVEAVDVALGGGLRRGCLHEAYAPGVEDATSAVAFLAMLAVRASQPGQQIVWLREERAARRGGITYAPGLAELGIDPGQCLFIMASDIPALLRASIDAVRSRDVGAAIVETHGRVPQIDLTASRRFALAAEKSGATFLLLRSAIEPVPSAADTRWQVESAPSALMEADAPGAPTFDLGLLRRRGGPSGMRWRLEWNRDQRIFAEAPLSGAMVPVPARRPVEIGPFGSGTEEPLRRIA